MSFSIYVNNKSAMMIPYRTAGDLIDKIPELNNIFDPKMKVVVPKIISNNKLKKTLIPLKNALKDLEIEKKMVEGLIDNIEKTISNKFMFEIR